MSTKTRRRRVLDTSVLISFLRKRRSETRQPLTTQIAKRWADELIAERESNFIAFPVLIEVLAGARASVELHFFRDFLACFVVIDGGTIPPTDWAQAQKFAERVPKDGKPRQLGDCLIAAIAKRLRYEVISLDLGFPS